MLLFARLVDVNWWRDELHCMCERLMGRPSGFVVFLFYQLA
jgi:hypothetical protein